MHCDTRLLFFLSYLTFLIAHDTDEQSYHSFIEFHRGGDLTKLILASPHGGFLGSNQLTGKYGQSTMMNTASSLLLPLPIGGCYNITLDRCVYNLQECLRANIEDTEKPSFQPDARCMLDRSSTSAMYSLTKSIAETFSIRYRPYTILNRLTRHYVDPAEDLTLGTFLFESATRVYMDYHRLIAMSKEAIRSESSGLFIEFTFHQDSETIQLGYGFDVSRTSLFWKQNHTTIWDLLSRSGSNIVRDNRSLSYFLHKNGFEHVIPLDHQYRHRHHQQSQLPSYPVHYRTSTHSTRAHADTHFNAILFSYPIERLRTHSIKLEASRITKAIEQFMVTNRIQLRSSSLSLSFNSVLFIYSFFILLFSASLLNDD